MAGINTALNLPHWIRPIWLTILRLVVVWLPSIFPRNSGNVIIPIDFHIFQRGGPTTNQFYAVSRIITSHWFITCLKSELLTASSFSALPSWPVGTFPLNNFAKIHPWAGIWWDMMGLYGLIAFFYGLIAGLWLWFICAGALKDSLVLSWNILGR